MLCPACGKETAGPASCEWCFNPLAAAPAPFSPVQPTPAAAVPGYLQPPSAAPATPPYTPPAPPYTPPAPGYAAPAQPAYQQPYAPQPLTGPQPLAGTLAGGPTLLDLTQPVPNPLDMTQPVTHGGNVRMALTGEIVEATPPPNYLPPAAPIPAPGYPQPAGYQPLGATGRPMPGAAVVRNLPPGAVSPQMVAAARLDDEVTLGERWEKALALLLPTLLAAVVAVHFVPSAYLWIELGALFLAALYMGATRAVDSYEEAFAECMGVLIISYFFGPVVGLGGCLLLGMVRQEMNAPLVWLLGVHVVARFMLLVSAGSVQGVPLFSSEADLSMILPHLNIFSPAGFISFFIVCATFAGWMMSSFFRPVNEN